MSALLPRPSAVFAYSLADNMAHQLTDGLSEARYAVFDKDSKHLYFAASTDVGLTSGWLDMSSQKRPVTRSVYVVVLTKDQPSPLAPESDEEGEGDEDEDKSAEDHDAEDSAEDQHESKDDEEAGADKQVNRDEKDKKTEPVKIDFDGINQRILALPVGAKNYTGLYPGEKGVLFLREDEVVNTGSNSGSTLHRFDLKKRKAEPFLSDVRSVHLSHNGKKLLYRKKDAWSIVETKAPPKGDKEDRGKLKTPEMEVLVNPPQEWKQMYEEAWRIQRDYFYDPGLHGLDWKKTSRKYKPFLDNLGSRLDLTYLFLEMFGEMSVGHLNVGGG